jgi:Flp pilus assembly pilin Flp
VQFRTARSAGDAAQTALPENGIQPARESNALGDVMKLFTKLVKDEQGGEVLEYALIAGLIVVAAIAVITSVGGKVLARWTSLNSSL